MFENCKTTRDQGDVGLACAIYKLTNAGYVVSVPLTDNNSYDLVVEKDGKFSSVQVKTTKHRDSSGDYAVGLRRMRHNRNSLTIHKLDTSKFDFLFILSADGKTFFIPSNEMSAKSGMALTAKYQKYLI